MATDIAPQLIGDILKAFNEKMKEDAEVQRLLELVNNPKISHKEAHQYSHQLGRLLSECFSEHIDYKNLPDGKMYFNIADRLVRQTYQRGYDEVIDYAVKVQELLNANAGLGLKAAKTKIDEDRLIGIIERLSASESYDDVSWILGEPTINFMDNVVDQFVEAQVDFHARAGLKPKLIRSVLRPCCEWCESLAGTYDYPVDRQIYMRHRHCDCVVEYFPQDGRGAQNSHTKRWRK